VRTGENLMSTDECATNIWGALSSGPPDKPVLYFGEAVAT
jgi:hypothetical protein